MVQRDDVAREREHGIRETEVVLARLREALDLPHDVVPEVADRTTVQRHLHERRRRQPPEDDVERVEQTRTGRQRADVVREIALDADDAATAADDEEGVEADEGVAAPPLTVLGRLEQEARPLPTHAVVHAERRVQVREDAPCDRNDPMVLRESEEPLERRRHRDAHAGPVTPRWKQLRRPVWQATPVCSTLMTRASSSQSVRTSTILWTCPEVAPFSHSS